MEKVLKLYKYIDGINDSPFPSESEQIVVANFRYDAKRMSSAPTIVFTSMHRTCLDDLWSDNVYAIFNGERYFIKQTPTSSYSNADTRYKHEVELISERSILDNVFFYDVVTEDGAIDKPVSNSPKFSFYGDIHEYVSRLNHSLSFSGLEYSIVVDEGVNSDESLVSFDSQVITNALQEIYNIYNIPYYFNGKVIHVGYYKDDINYVFKYGDNDSLISISKQNASSKIINRITGVGSSDNIPYYYPNDDARGITRPLLNGGTSGVSVINATKYKKLRLSDELKYYSSINELVPLLNDGVFEVSNIKHLGLDESTGLTRYMIDFYYTFTLDDAKKVKFDIWSVDLEKTEDLKYNISKEGGQNFGYFSGEKDLELNDGTYTLIVRWLFFDEQPALENDESTYNFINLYVDVSANIVVEASESWTLKGLPILLSDYGLNVDSASNGDVITIELLSYIHPQPNLMPPIYRYFLERFYEAKDNTFVDDKTGDYYVFENEYSTTHPREHIENFDNIKPTIKNVTNEHGDRIDRFVDFAYDLDDNDETDQDGNFYHPYFFAKLNKTNGIKGFNLFEHSIDESDMTISVTSGSCGSCEFIIGVDENTQKNLVQVDEYGNLLRDSNGNVRCGRKGMQKETPQDVQNDTENNEVWIALKKDIQTFGVVMPNATNNYKPSIGDTFVILHIDLPKTYIEEAEKKLEQELIRYMHDNNAEKFNFSISFSRIFFAENPSILERLSENSKIKIEYNKQNYELYASSLSYSISNDSPLPEIKIDLNDTITISQNQINQVVNSAKKDIISSIKKDVLWGDIKGVPSWITSEKPKYSYNEILGSVPQEESDVWVIKKDSNGNAYLFTTFPVVTQYGITMYSGDGVDVPSLASGLPFDGRTIWYNPETNQIEVIGGTGGGSGEGVSNFWDLSGIPSWITNSKPKYTYSEIEGTPDLTKYALVSQIPSLSGYATESWVLGKGYATTSDLDGRINALINGAPQAYDTLKEIADVLEGNVNSIGDILTTLGNKADKATTLGGYGITDAYTKANVNNLLKGYVTISGTEDVTGIHNFTNGIKVGGIVLKKFDDGVVYIDGNLVVKGGVTMYGDENADIPTIYDGLPIDNVTIYWENTSNGKVLKAKVGTEGAITEITSAMVISALGFTPYDASNPNGYITSSALNGYATQTWVKNQGYLTSHQDLSGYQPLITSSNKLAYSLISGTPTSLKNPNALSFGSKSYDGSAKITLTAGDLGALTSHQTIYTLTFASGTFASSSFTANSANKTINIPTTTSHISEGSNLYFTNTRAINALAETLKAYVTLGGTQTITGEKNFTGGLKVNGSPIYYDTEKKYWKLEGDLLVTGGVTMYGSDSSFTPSTIMDAIVVDNVTIIKQDGKLVALGGGSSGGGVADAVAWGNVLGKPSWITDTTPSISISGTSVSLGGSITQSALRTALGLGSNAYTSTAYLPLSGGTITNTLQIGSNDNTSFLGLRIVRSGSALMLNPASSNAYIGLGAFSNGTYSNKYMLLFGETGLKYSEDGQTTFKDILHSGNYSNYALPLSGGEIKGVTTINGDSKTNVPIVVETPSMNYNGYIKFASSGTTNGYLGMGGIDKPVFRSSAAINYTLWHSGNDGSGSGLDADLLDGRHSSGFAIYEGIVGANVSSVAASIGYTYATQEHGGLYAGGFINFGTNGYFCQLHGNVSHSALAYRFYNIEYGKFSDWKSIAFTDSNVASATKLQTARTIWGQSFDGTGNVSGHLYLQNSHGIRVYDASGKNHHALVLDDANNMLFGSGTSAQGYPTVLYGNHITFRYGTSQAVGMLLNSSGNVGIGTTNPSSKLHVSGDITASGTLSSVGLFANDGTIILKNSANGSGLLVYPGIDESTSARFEIRTNNAWARTGFTLFTNGNFTIGTSNDQGYRFFVAGDTKVQGNILATGGITTNDSVTINGIKLSKSKDGVLYLDGNLVVKGGVTMYGTDATSSPSILDSLPIASTTSMGIAQFNPSDFAVKDGVVSFVGSVDGGVASSVSWGNITGKPTFATVATSGKYSDLNGLPTIPTSLKNPHSLTFGSKTYDGSAARSIVASDLGALTAHQSIYALTIKNSRGTTQLTYTPNSAAGSLTLTKAMVGLGNVENTALSTWTGTNKITTLGTITSGTWNGSKIVNAYLANSSVTISGESVSLGGSITQSALRSALGLGSNAYTSTAYLPLSGGTMGGNIVFQGGYLRFTNSSGSFLGAYNVNDSGDALYLKGSAWNKILHSGNYSEYALPLSGGTLSGNLTIQNTSVDIITLHRASNSGSPSIKFTNKSDGTLGYMGVSDSSRGLQPFFMDTGSSVFKIWHEGNDGSGSALDADLLDGRHSSGFAIYEGIVGANVSSGVASIGYTYATQEHGGLYAGGFINFGTNGYFCQLNGNVSQSALAYRFYNTEYGKFSDWKSIAFTDSNVASATKLQTARTIWGQSFDGTRSVCGNLFLETAYSILSYNSDYSASYELLRMNSAYGLVIGLGSSQAGGNLYLNGNQIFLRYGVHNKDGLYLNSSGNVGIGTTSPSSKLHVSGDITASGTLSSVGLFANDGTIILKNSANGSGLLVYPGIDESTSARFEIRTNNAWARTGFTLFTNGNFTIGTSNDQGYRFFVAGDSKVQGNILATGGITMYSMRKLKNVLDERGLSLSELSTIKPTRYTWKDGRDNRLHFGGIADDIQQVLPEVVYKTSDGILTMDYGNAAFAVASSLIQPVVDHEKRIAMLEKENKELRNEVERLKSA